MSFENIFKKYSLEEEFESFSEDFFLQKNLKEIKFSLNMFIDDSTKKCKVYDEIVKLKEKFSNKKVNSIEKIILEALNTSFLNKTNLIKEISKEIKKCSNLSFNVNDINNEIEDLEKKKLLVQKTKGKSKIYSLTNLGKSRLDNLKNEIPTSSKVNDNNDDFTDDERTKKNLDEKVDNILKRKLDEEQKEDEESDSDGDGDSMTKSKLYEESKENNKKIKSKRIKKNMHTLFQELFDNEQLKTCYSNLSDKLIYKKKEEIKEELKQTVEKNVGREIYKSIYQSTLRIKEDYSRKPGTDNVMITVDTLEQCLPSPLALETKREKNKFINQFMENLKSNVEMEVFRKHDQYERISGFLVGREPKLKSTGDGTTRIKRKIQSSVKNDSKIKKKVQPQIQVQKIQVENGSSDDEF